MLLQLKRSAEAKSILRKVIPLARRVLGTEHHLTLSFRENHATVLLLEDSESGSPDKVSEALGIFEEVHEITRRVCGPQHPHTQMFKAKLEFCRRLSRK